MSKLLYILILLLFACSPKESHRTLEPQKMQNAAQFNISKAKVAIGDFINRSTYMNGIFADSGDRIGKQAKQILTTHLTQSNAFIVLDRENLEALERESRFSKSAQNIKGADALLTGAVTEFGRKETGTGSLGGIIHQTKTQTLYAKVAISVVNISSSAVIQSYQGAGEYMLTNKQVLGFGGSAGYDSTLADKVLNLAIMEAIQNMIEGRAKGEW